MPCRASRHHASCSTCRDPSSVYDRQSAGSRTLWEGVWNGASVAVKRWRYPSKHDHSSAAERTLPVVASPTVGLVSHASIHDMLRWRRAPVSGRNRDSADAHAGSSQRCAVLVLLRRCPSGQARSCRASQPGHARSAIVPRCVTLAYCTTASVYCVCVRVRVTQFVCTARHRRPCTTAIKCSLGTSERVCRTRNCSPPNPSSAGYPDMA